MSVQPVNNLAGELASLQIVRNPARQKRPMSAKLLAGLSVAAVAALIAGVVLATSLSRKSVETALVVLVQPGEEPPLFVATGTVTAPVTATLAPRVPGRLSKRLVEEGDRVVPEQPVAALDSTDLRLALIQAQADEKAAQARVQAAQVAVRAAEVRSSRAERLFKGAAGPESAAIDAALEVDTARAQVAVAEADWGLAKARVTTAQQNLNDTILRAPFHGVVLHVLAQPGDFVSTASGQGVVQLADLSSLEMDAEVSEANLAKLVNKMPVEVRLDALPNQGIVGHVFSIRPNVDVAKATAIAKVRMDVSDDSVKIPLFPGMNGRVNFLAHEPAADALKKAPQLEVPAAAIVRENDQTSVFTVGKDGRVAPAKVALNGTDGERVVLASGPPAGTVVVAVPRAVKPGDRVELANP
jgi:HlyD family secretion protein